MTDKQSDKPTQAKADDAKGADQKGTDPKVTDRAGDTKDQAGGGRKIDTKAEGSDVEDTPHGDHPRRDSEKMGPPRGEDATSPDARSGGDPVGKSGSGDRAPQPLPSEGHVIDRTVEAQGKEEEEPPVQDKRDEADKERDETTKREQAEREKGLRP